MLCIFARTNISAMDLDNILNDRDEKLGYGGDYNVVIRLKNGHAMLRINNLKQAAARILFDQIDESNSVTTAFIIEIIDGSGKVIDYNHLPNAFSSIE